MACAPNIPGLRPLAEETEHSSTVFVGSGSRFQERGTSGAAAALDVAHQRFAGSESVALSLAVEHAKVFVANDGDALGLPKNR
jgi:hypothetical protein